MPRMWAQSLTRPHSSRCRAGCITLAGVKERIQKVLGNAGVASRRNIEEMVRQGRVSVNGTTPTELPVLIDPETDNVIVDGETVRLGRRGKRRGKGDDAAPGGVGP